MSYVIVDSNTFNTPKIAIQTKCIKCWLQRAMVPEATTDVIAKLFTSWRQARCRKFQECHQAELSELLAAGYDVQALFGAAMDKIFTVKCILTLEQVVDLMLTSDTDADNGAMTGIMLYQVSDHEICDAVLPAHAKMTAVLNPIKKDYHLWQKLGQFPAGYGARALDYALHSKDMESVQWLQLQGVDVASRISDLLLKHDPDNDDPSMMIDNEFIRQIGLDSQDYHLNLVLNSDFDIKDILSRYQVADFGPAHCAKLWLRVLAMPDITVQQLQMVLDAMPNLDWPAIQPYLANVSQAIMERRDLLIWCAQHGWPFDLLQTAFMAAIRGYVAEYMPIFQVMQTIMPGDYVAQNLTRLMVGCRDLELLDHLVRNHILDPYADAETILQALCGVLPESYQGKNHEVLDTIIAYLQMRPEYCQRVLKQIAIDTTDDISAILKILDTMDIQLQPENICHWSRYYFNKKSVAILRHKACQNIDWNHKLTMEQVAEIWYDGDDLDASETKISVTSGLPDMTILELMLLWGHNSGNHAILKWILNCNIAIDWSRLNAYYTYYLQLTTESIIHMYPPDHMFRELGCAYGHPECFYTRFLAVEPYGVICDFMAQHNLLDTRIAQFRNDTREASQLVDHDAFYFSDSECDTPDNSEIYTKFTLGNDTASSDNDDTDADAEIMSD